MKRQTKEWLIEYTVKGTDPARYMNTYWAKTRQSAITALMNGLKQTGKELGEVVWLAEQGGDK